MSFILDALRKSEHERQRSSAPGLSHVPLATPRRELPRWAVLVIGALGAAVLVLGGAWWQSTLAPRAGGNAPVARSEPLPVPPAATTIAPAPITYAAPPVAQPPPATRPLAQAGGVESPPATPSANTAAPVAELAAASAPAANQPALPSAAALAADGIVLPPLRLELHAYAERSSDRFVFINGRKYVEGDRLAEGPELLTIAPNGAVLRHLGQRFLLAPE